MVIKQSFGIKLIVRDKVIIKATLKELDDLVGLFDAYRVFYKKESALALGREFLKARLERNESHIFIAYRGSVPAGFTQLYPKYSSARLVQNWILNDLYVAEDFRRLGIGEQLIEEAMLFAKQQGADFVQLETQVENLTAQALYDKVGFELQKPDQEFLLFKKLT